MSQRDSRERPIENCPYKVIITKVGNKRGEDYMLRFVVIRRD